MKQRVILSACHLVTLSRSRAAPGQIAVEQQQRRWLAAGHLQLLDDLAGVLLFLNLLGDEPLQQRLGGVVALFQRQLVEPVDQCRDLALVIQRLLEHIQRRLELTRRLVERLKLHAAAAVVQEIEELHPSQLYSLWGWWGGFAAPPPPQRDMFRGLRPPHPHQIGLCKSPTV